MTRKKVVKAVSLSLAWALFLYLVITNWNYLPSAQWQDLTDTVKATGITKFIRQNVDDIFFFGLCSLFILLWLANSYLKMRRRNIQESLKPIEFTERAGVTEEDEAKLVNNIGIINNPAYRSMSCNIHHRWHDDRISKGTDA